MSAALRKMLSLAVFAAASCLLLQMGYARAGCAFDPTIRRFRSVDEMPTALSEFLLGKFRDQTAQGIAARDGQFNATDVIHDADLPRRRLLDAGGAGDRWFLWYEHGGRGLHRHMILLEYRLGGRVELVRNTAALNDDFCVLTKSWLAGATLPNEALRDLKW